MGQFENLLDMWDERMITTKADSKRKEMIQIVFPALFSEDLDYRRSPRYWTRRTYDCDTEEFELHSRGDKERSLRKNGII